MKNWKKFAQDWLTSTCVIYTVFVICFLILAKLLQEGMTVPALNLRNAFCFLGFAFGWAGANQVLHIELGTVTRYVFHATILLIDFILFVLVLPGNLPNGFAILTFSLFFLFFYALIMILRGLLYLARREKENSKKEYTKTFSQK